MKLTEEQKQHVLSLADDEGRVTPDKVLADAKKKNSPLHTLYDWNVQRAAEAHWLEVSRQIVRKVVYLETTEITQVKLPAFVRDPEAKPDEQGYRTVTTLKNDPLQARRSLIYTLEVAAGHIRRALNLSVAFGLESEIDGLLEKVTGLQRSLQEEVAA